MKELHRLLYFLRSELLYLISFLTPSKTTITVSATKTLKAAGYEFHELWEEIPTLPEAELDLSIIIPVYNSEKFLRKCLTSILAQRTNYSYEVICVNDGSTDGCLDILDELATTHHNLIIISQENQGISGARNTGIKNARGRYIGFIDNDDYVSEDYVETIMARAIETGADFIQTAYQDVDINGNTLAIVSRGNRQLNKHEFTNNMFTLPGFIWGGCMKREILEKVRFPMGFWYEDMIMRMLIMRMSNKVASIAEPHYNYLKHGNNASLTLWKRNHIKAIDEFWLARQLVEYGNKALSLPVDDYIYSALIDEWSSLLWVRTKGLSMEVRKSVFMLVADYLCQLNYDFKTEDKYYKAINKVFAEKDFRRWNILSKALLLKRCRFL